MFAGMRWDGWEVVGLIGEGLFFARMAAQWVMSERARRPVIPTAYWYMSLAGAVILILYALHLGSFAVLLPQVVGVVFYARGLHLDILSRRRDARRQEFGFDNDTYPWPAVSIIVPVHNEEATLRETLAGLTAQVYAGPQPEIIAALNGCTDHSRREAEAVPGVTIAESDRSGMSFGKNLGAGASHGDFLVFIDADTRVPPDAVQRLVEAAAGLDRFIGTVAGAPDRGGFVVKTCFRIANWATRRKQAHAPGGVMLMDRETFSRVGGFDETLPQGTSTDMIWRGIESGARYVYVDSFQAVTSIRRFEKTGIIRQMLSWRSNHRAFAAGRRETVSGKAYEDIR
ncbi:MAG: lipid-A-disaccharide synthase N-terminal domain-containing protein [Planctomycetes bacterium]|nr:lipid-A-disaccharide synthase N-terminal domain-containing protein [Planctomycetota bacterium]